MRRSALREICLTDKIMLKTDTSMTNHAGAPTLYGIRQKLGDSSGCVVHQWKPRREKRDGTCGVGVGGNYRLGAGNRKIAVPGDLKFER
jgi:hypothetical protein